MAKFLIFFLLFVIATPAQADPVSVSNAIAFAVFNAGASVAVTNAVLIGVTAIASAAPFLLTGAGLYQQSQYRRGLTNLNNDEGLQQITRQAIPAQRLILGTGVSSGALFFSRGDEDTKPYVYFGYLLAAHKCDSLQAVTINNQRVLLDENGFATTTPFDDGVTKFIQVSFRNGDIDQAIDPILAADFPDIPSTFRQRGHATAVIKAHFGTGSDNNAKRDKNQLLYGSRGLDPLFETNGSLIFDPRDPAQVLGQPDTYKWSANASLNLMHFLQWKMPHMGDRIQWDRVAEAADIDDEWGFTKEGKAYRKNTIDGIIKSDESAFDVIEGLLSANAGRLILDQGKIYPSPARRKTPVATLHMGMVKGGFQYSSHAPFGQTVNTIKTEFQAPDRDNKIVTGPVIDNSSFLAEDGVVREKTIRFPFTRTHQRSQLLGNLALKRGRSQKSLSTGVNIEALRWKPNDVIRVDFPAPYDEVNGTYELISISWDDHMSGYSISLIEYDEAAFDYNPANEERDFVIDENTLDAA